jgi:hypothetical protein
MEPFMRHSRGTRSLVSGLRGVRLLAVTAPALLILAGTAACTGTQSTSAAGSSTAPSASAAPSASTTVAATATAGTTATSTGGAGTSQIAACTATGIKADLIGQSQASTATTRMAMLQLTNTSAHPCRLYGWAGVTLTNAAGETVPVPTTKVSQPGAPTTADLPPGTTASAGIKWTICDKGASDCPVGNGLMVSVPGGTATVPANLTEFPAPEKSDITMKSLQIGSIQPSKQGVVAW